MFIKKSSKLNLNLNHKSKKKLNYFNNLNIFKNMYLLKKNVILFYLIIFTEIIKSSQNIIKLNSYISN